MSSKVSRVVAILAFGGVVFSSACKPTCTQTCNKLTSCSANADWEGEYAELCAENCERQHNLYEVWEDTQLLDALDASQSCVKDATCEDLEEGVCYDETLYTF